MLHVNEKYDLSSDWIKKVETLIEKSENKELINLKELVGIYQNLLLIAKDLNSNIDYKNPKDLEAKWPTRMQIEIIEKCAFGVLEKHIDDGFESGGLSDEAFESMKTSIANNLRYFDKTTTRDQYTGSDSAQLGPYIKAKSETRHLINQALFPEFFKNKIISENDLDLSM